MEEDVLLEPCGLPSVRAAKPVRGARLVVALLALLSLLVGCDSDDGDSKQAGTEPTSTTEVVPQGSPPEGRFFAVAGERGLEADLYQIKFAPLQMTRLTTGSRVGGVSGCRDQLIVSAAQQEVGFSDTIQSFKDGRLGSVDGLGMPKGSIPTVTPDCRVAYLMVDRESPDLINRLHRWDPASQKDEVLFSAPQIGGFDLGPAGQLAVIERMGGEPGQPLIAQFVILVTSGQAPRTLPAPAPDLGQLRWGAASRMALSRVTAKSTLFFDPATGERTDLAGWLPLGWSPDGHQLLVGNAADRRIIGVVDDSDLSVVRKLGRADVAVFEVSWLPAS